MPSFGPAFDPLAFDVSAFDASYAAPLLLKVSVPRECRKVAPGSVVVCYLYIMQVSTLYNHRFYLNTETIPQIQIYKPDGSIHVSLVNMVNSDLGVYKYQHQVGVGDISGPYSAHFRAVNGDKVMITNKMALFEVV